MWLTANVDTCNAKQIIKTVLFIMFGSNGGSSSPGAKSTFNFTLPSLKYENEYYNQIQNSHIINRNYNLFYLGGLLIVASCVK